MSEVHKLTDRFVRAAKPSSGKLREVIDAGLEARGSLMLRISPNGLKTWTFIYRNPAGLQRWYRIGHYPHLSLAKARETARKLSGQVVNGEDPAEDRLKQKTAARKAMRFGELARLYMRDHAKLHKAASSQYEDQRILDKDLLPAWKNRDIRTITRAEIAAPLLLPRVPVKDCLL